MEKYKANIDKCSFSQFHTETVFHLFWTCHNTVQLCKNIGSFINENIQQDESITFKGIVLDIMTLTLLKAIIVLL